MPDIKLARLPDRTPIKIGILVMPELHDRLLDYAATYAEAYGVEESVVELIPAIVAAFLDSDRGFGRTKSKKR